MRMSGFDRKILCKNRPFSVRINDIISNMPKKPGIAAFLGRRAVGKSDKGSRHVVGKCPQAGER